MLAADEIAVWYQHTETLTAPQIEAFDEVLSEDERKRRDRFAFARDSRDFAAAHALLRQVLSKYAPTGPRDWRFDRDDAGKPSLVRSQASTPPLAFNISHTHGLVACAVTRVSAIGVDVERCDRAVGSRDIAPRYFARAEIEYLERCEPAEYQQRFTELWTLKEAYIKAVGLGLGLPLHSFSFTFDQDGRTSFSPADGAHDALFWLAALPAGARLAVACLRDTLGPSPRVTFHDAQHTHGATATLLRSSRD